MARSSLLLTALVLLLSVACAEADRRPAPPEPPAQTVEAGGLALTALAGTWRGFPPDLGRYYVPIEVVVVNDRAERAAIRPGDFALLDAAGGERAALPPREATTRLFGVYGRRSRLAPVEPPAGAVVPARSSFFFSWHFGWPYYPWGPYYPYGYPYGPYYATPRRPTYEEATGDLLRFGLTEGSVEPKGSVRGFLYFPRGERDDQTLRLRWAAAGLPSPLVAPVSAPY